MDFSNYLKIFMLMLFLARQDETLKEHLLLVGNELKNLAENELEEKVFYLIGISHDFGKYTKIFQWKLQEENLKGDKAVLVNQYGNHSQLGALLFMFVMGKNGLLKNNEILPYFIAGINAIFKHHGELKNIDYLKDKGFWDDTLKIIKKQVDYLDDDVEKEINELLNGFIKFDLKEFKFFINQLNGIEALFDRILNINCEDSFLIKKIYSNLLYADKYKTIFRREEKETINHTLDANLIDKYRIKKGFHRSSGFLNDLRNKLYNQINERLKQFNFDTHFLILNAPTGIGKTLNLLNIGFKLQARLQNSRIVYGLPFTSIIDQTEEILKDILGKNFDKFVFKHHHLAGFEESGSSVDLESYNKRKFLLNAWDKKIILTTFWQIFHTFFHNKNKLNIKFTNWENTIFLLDEVQSIPYKYWEVVRQMMKILAEQYNCYFVLSSATLPKFLKNEKIFDLVPNYKNYFQVLNRTKLNLTIFNKKINFDELEYFVSNKLKENKSILFTFNTIKSSIEFFNRIKNLGSNKPVYYLSTNIIPKCRKKRIKKIKEKIKQGKKVILVTTQLIEAGVDIDFDTGFRDFAPIDSVIQILGRLNRNAKKKQGELFLFRLKDVNNVNEREYSSYIYNFFVRNISSLLLKNKKIIEEKDFLSVFEKYFEYILENSSKEESKELWEYFCRGNFEKLVQGFNLIENNYETIDVFIDLDDFSNQIRKEFEKTKNIKDIWEKKMKWDKIKKDFLSYTIQISVKNAIKVGLLTDDWIGEKEYRSGIVYLDKDRLNSYYNMETGFKYETDDFI